MWRFTDEVKHFAKSIVGQFHLGSTLTRVGIVEFSNGARVTQNLDTDQVAIENAINQYRPSGATHIGHGLEVGYGLLQLSRHNGTC